MTPNPPPRKSQTMLGALTQAVQKARTRINFSKLTLKPEARVPELLVQDAGADKAETYPLLGDRYLLGRSSQSCDIVVRNPVVSQVHLSVLRDQPPQGAWWGRLIRSPFVLRDENSTNGIFRGKRRLKSVVLKHNAVYTLGPPELAASVRLQFIDPPPWYVQAYRYMMYGIGGLSLVTGAIVALQWQRFAVNPLPLSVQGPVVVYARDGQTPLSPTTNRTHTELKGLKDYSPYLPLAVMASEDSRFYAHLGIDPIGVARAAVTNVKGGGIREGASTLTQQLARSIFRSYVGSEDSAGRKVREAIVALKLEFDYSKDFLLLTYLNRVYMGYGNFGFEDAARFYFAKPAKDLSLAEAATLAGILPAPNSYNPVQNYDKAIEQRNGVLTRMTELGQISADEANKARRSRIEVNPKAKEELSKLIAPYYYSHVFNELQELLGDSLAAEGNFIVQTSLDIPTQLKAEASLRNAVDSVGASAGFSQGAIVTIDSKTGEVMALVGGVDYKKSQFNRASQAYRQPGSTFKMFTYTTAIEQGFSGGSAFSCAPLNWEGQYYEGCRGGGGSLTIATGLAQSENVVALRVAQQVGLDKVVNTARRMGIRAKLNPVPGLVLGQSEVTPLEMASAFNILANRGVRNPPRAIRRIYDGGECKNPNDYSTCRLMYSNDQDAERSQVVLSPAVADTMTSLLQGVVRGGTGRAAAIGLGEAGKTGTTNNNVDLWFIGYIPSGMTTAIWLGNDNNSPTGGSSAVAAELWRTYMSQVVK